MSTLDRRELLQAGLAAAAPLASLSLFGQFQPSASPSTDKNNDQENKGKTMQIRYLEIVTSEADALCKQYESMHGVKFGQPDQNLGNARTAKVDGGGMIAIRGPLRADEAPVIRPYVLVKDLKASVAEAEKAGAKIALPFMEIPGHGKIAIVIQGGIECGLWQDH